MMLFPVGPPLNGACGVGERSNAISNAVYRARALLRGRDSAEVVAAALQLEDVLQRCFDGMHLQPLYDDEGVSESPDRTWFTDCELLQEALGTALTKTDPLLKGWKTHELYAVLALRAAQRAFTAPPPVEFRRRGRRGFFIGGMTYEPSGEAYELVARAEAQHDQHRSRVRGAQVAGSGRTQEAKAWQNALIRRARNCLEERGWEPKDLAGALAQSFGRSQKQVRRVLQAEGILSTKKKRDT